MEPVPLQEPATKRPKHAKVANEDFHLRFEQPMEAENPQEQPVATGGRRTQRRLNAEELAVADGLLGLQEVRYLPVGDIQPASPWWSLHLAL